MADVHLSSDELDALSEIQHDVLSMEFPLGHYGATVAAEIDSCSSATHKSNSAKLLEAKKGLIWSKGIEDFFFIV